MNNFTYIKKYGADIETVFDELAELRIAVFKAYPYLYAGSIEYEKDYLKTYMRSPKSMLFAVYADGKMVGATTCIPLSDETPEVQEPFIKAEMPIETIFYFGESILLPEMRGKGLGHRFFDEREAHAHRFNTFKKTCFCAVVRPENHPMKPQNYVPLDAFWLKRGYQKVPALQSQFDWTDIGDVDSTFKPMVYWMRDL